MDLIDSFQTSCWAKGDSNDDTGFKHYQLAHRKVIDAKKGEYSYAVYNDEGDLKQVILKGAGKRDPLNGVGNVELRLSEDGKNVHGVLICDECVLYTGS